MRYGVLGSGSVGQTVGSALVALGDEVCMGSRDPANESATAWAASAGKRARNGTFADAAAFAEQVIVNATAGTASVAAIGSASPADLEGKVLLDIANPLDFSGGFPPRLSVSNDDSLAESIQRAYPGLRVVKALNTVTAAVMVEPSRVPGDHVIFACSDDGEAKAVVRSLLGRLGWPQERIVDLGGLDAARATEGYLPLWVRLYQQLGTGDFNITISR